MTGYTQEQIDEWLQAETRTLTLPGGESRSITSFRLVWDKADSLVILDGYSMEELAGFAAEEAALQNVSFERAFVAVVGWLDAQRRDRWGVP